MKIIAISDTHCAFPELPDGDLLIHAGDWGNFGDLAEYREFKAWLKSVRPRFKYGILLVNGNHDHIAESVMWNDLDKPFVELCGNNPITINGITFAGGPWVNTINGRWAFERTPEQQEDLWKAVPKCNVLITHSPPFGILDAIPSWTAINKFHLGSEELLEQLDHVRPSIHIFGHIHESHGFMEHNGTRFYNVAIMDKKYRPVNPVTVIEL